MAFVLADVAHAHPTRVVWLEELPEVRAQLELLCGSDADLRCDANRVTNRLRALLSTHWPALERTLGERLDTRGGLAVLRTYPSGPALHRAGLRRVQTLLRTQHVRQPEAWAEHLVQAADRRRQTLAVPGADTAARLVAELATQLSQLLARRNQPDQEIERAFFALPEAMILLSLPGIGSHLGARIAVEIGRTVARFATPSWLPTLVWDRPRGARVPPSSVPSRFGNHCLKNTFLLAAFASLRHPPSRTYYDRKRAEGERHNQAILYLARRRVDVLNAMLSHGSLYRPPAPSLPLAA
jgi:hypothetical protein